MTLCRFWSKPRLLVLLVGAIAYTAPKTIAQDSEPTSRVATYDVRDLLRGPRDTLGDAPPLRHLLLQRLPGAPQSNAMLEFGSAGSGEEPLLGPATGEDELRESAAELIHRLDLGDPENEDDASDLWDSMQVVDGILRAELSDRAHRALERMLAEMRRATGATILVECVLVSPEDWARLVSASKVEPTAVSDEIFEQALLIPGTQLLSVECFERQLRTAGPTTRDVGITEYEINQTGVIPVANPVVETFDSGARLSVRAYAAGDDGRVLVDVWAGKFSTQADKSHELGGSYGTVTLPIRKATRLATTVVCGAQAVRVARIGGEDGLVALVRATATTRRPSGEAAPLAGSGLVYRVYPAALLFRRPNRRALQDSWSTESISYEGDDDSAEPVHSPWNEERLREALEAHFGEEKLEELDPTVRIRGGRAIEVLGSAEIHEFVKSLVAVEIERRCRQNTTDLEILELPRDAYVDLRRRSTSGMLLPTDWDRTLAGREDVRRARYSVGGTSDEVHILRDATIENFVLGVELVSGGTGFAIIDVADPIVGDAGSGAELRVAVSLGATGTTAHLRLSGMQTRIVDRRTVKVRYPMISEEDVRATGGAAAMSGTTLQLYLPSQEAVRWSATRNLPIGRWALLQAESGPGGKIRALVGRVRAAR